MFRKTVGEKKDMPIEEKAAYYRMVKRDYTRYGATHTQEPKFKRSPRYYREMEKKRIAKEKEAADAAVS